MDYMAMGSMGAQGYAAVAQTVGAWYAARSQKEQLKMRAEMAELAARGQLMAGEREQQRSMLQTAQLKSGQITAMAANGVDLSVGTANRLLTSTDLMGQIDAATIRSNALRAAFGQKADAIQMRASASAINPGLMALSSLAGGAGQVAQSWYSFNKAGAFDANQGSVTFADFKAGSGYGSLTSGSGYGALNLGGKW